MSEHLEMAERLDELFGPSPECGPLGDAARQAAELLREAAELEAALREIAAIRAYPLDVDAVVVIERLQDIARAALEGKK